MMPWLRARLVSPEAGDRSIGKQLERRGLDRTYLIGDIQMKAGGTGSRSVELGAVGDGASSVVAPVEL
jgi:hypothetical protein